MRRHQLAVSPSSRAAHSNGIAAAAAAGGGGGGASVLR